jgi:2-methylcitrate dehydratase PrpD
VDYLDRLAAFVAATRYDTLPATTVAAAKLVLLDTLGAIGGQAKVGIASLLGPP